MGSYTRISQILSQAPMTTFVAPGCEFGAEHNATDALSKVDFAFLEVRTLFHKLVLADSLYYLSEY